MYYMFILISCLLGGRVMKRDGRGLPIETTAPAQSDKSSVDDIPKLKRQIKTNAAREGGGGAPPPPSPRRGPLPSPPPGQHIF